MEEATFDILSPLTNMNIDRKEQKIGYGDPECTEDCPIRKKHLELCDLAILLTEQEMDAGYGRKRIDIAAIYEDMQNKIALRLGCIPATNRI